MKHAAFRPSNLLLWLSGAQLDILERAPFDRAKFVGMGLAVLTSATVAAILMAFALRTAIAAPVPVAIVVALAWGFTVLSLNRLLLISLTGVRKWRSLLLLAAPRIMISIFLALVIATPLVLRIFAPEINAETHVIQQSQVAEYFAAEQTSPLGKQTIMDRALVSKLQETINSDGGKLPDPDKNPAVESLTAQLDKAEALMRADYARLQCALYGGPNCPSGRNISVSAAEAAYQADMTQVASLREQLTTLVQKLNETALADRAAEVEAARKELPAASAKLLRDQQAQQEADATFVRANNEAGILVKIKALSVAASGDTTLAVAQYLLLFFILAIDLMPILTRFLLRLGPPSAYDKILETQERVFADAVRHRAEMRMLQADLELTAQVRRAEQRRDLSSARRTSFKEQTVPHADGELRRLEIGDDEFLLVDVLDSVPTLNWTASIGARDFVVLVSERLERAGDAEESSAEIMISMAGIADQFDARLGVQLAALASPAFDRRSEFIRFDDPAIALALQSLHGDDGSQVKMFGVSVAGLSLDTVVSLMTRTATRGLAAHAHAASESPLIARLAELVHLPGQGDPALRWSYEGEVEHEQARR